MKMLLLNLMFVVCIALPSPGHAVERDDILGEWVTEDGDCRVEIFKKDQQYFGKIITIKPPNYLPGEISGMDGKPRLDSNNQDESKRSRTLAGIELMKNFRFDGGKWTGGKIYDPKNGETYQCEMSLSENGTLHVRGFVGISLFGRTTVWESAKAYLEKELSFLGLADCSCQ